MAVGTDHRSVRSAVGGLWSQPPAFWTALVAVVVLGVVLVGRPPSEGPPLDPASVGPTGTRALLLLLEELGAEVIVTDQPPEPGDPRMVDVALVLADDLDDAGRTALGRWVDSGGTLVVADPLSPLHPFAPESPPGLGLVEQSFDADCAIAALAGVGELDPPPGSVAYQLVDGSQGCFHRGEAAFVAVAPTGRGAAVAVGGAGLFTNQALGDGDNAVLAASLVVPSPGTRVLFLRPPVPGSGSAGLSELVSRNVIAALWQLAVAFLVYAAWRARRLGRALSEPQPVDLQASELVVAVGHLLQHARHHDQAARLVGDDLRRRLAERLGLSGDASPREVAEVAALRSGIPAERILAAIDPPRLRDAGDLVARVSEAEAIGREVVHGS